MERHPALKLQRSTLATGLALTLLGAPCAGAAAGGGDFASLYEPSGVAPSPDGKFVVVDDEPRRPLRLVGFSVDENGASLTHEENLDPPAGLFANWKLGNLDDLEGVAHDDHGRIYVIGSQNDEAGIGANDRRKLVRFLVDDSRMTDVAINGDVRADLLAALPEIRRAIDVGGKHDSQLDVEAIAFDRHRGTLLLGLRSPRIDDDAIIVTIANPDAWLDDRERLSASLRTIDLDRGGIRAMSYDDRSDALLLVSRRQSGKGAAYKLWSLAATGHSDPRRLRAGEPKLFDDVEGLAILDDGVLFVRDDGDRGKDRPGSWFFEKRTALGLNVDTP